MNFFIFQFRVTNFKRNFLFFNFELVTWSEIFTFQIRVSKIWNWNLMFHEVELVTRKNNFFKLFRVSNSKCDIILCNLIL